MDQFIRGFKHFFEAMLAVIIPDIDWYGVGVTFGLLCFVIVPVVVIWLVAYIVGVIKNANNSRH